MIAAEFRATSMPSCQTLTTALPRWCRWAMWALLVAKLVLVSHDEVLVYGADDTGYAYSAAGWYWGRAYAPHSYVRQPVYPLFVAAAGTLGVPLRIAIELVWFGACRALARAMRAWGLPAWSAPLLVAMVFFHPWVLWLNNRLLPDTLYAPLVVALVAAASMTLLAARGGRVAGWSVLAGACAALAANTRQESVLVYGMIVVVGALAAATVRRWPRRPAIVRLVCAAGIPLVMTLGLTHAFRLANKAHIGVYCTHELEAPGYKALYQALLSIAPEHPDPRLAVPRDVRERAYAVSPSFATLREALETSPSVAPYAEACERQTGVKREFGSWTCWALRQAVWVSQRGQIADGAEVDSLFARAAAELRAGLRDGRLPRRWAPIPFVPPEWRRLLAAAPGSAAQAWTMLNASFQGRPRSEALPASTVAIFDAAGMRRDITAAITAPVEADGSGWFRPAQTARLARVRGGVLAVHSTLVWGEVAASALGLLAGAWGVRRGWLDRRWLVPVGLVLVCVMSRVALVILLDVCGIPALRRYLIPVAVLLPVSAALGVHALAVIARRAADARRGGPGAARG